MVARKLALKEGDRVLDVGCGWGSFPLWAATKHGASVVGITLSPPQAEKARQRAEEAGVADRVEIRVMDYRDLRRRALRRDRQHRHGRARRRGADRRLRAHPRRPARAGRAAAQPRHRPPAPHRPRGRRLLGALRLPRRRPAAPLARPAGAGTGRLRHPPRRGASAPTTPRPCATGRGASTRTSTRRSASPAPNGSASGASTCAPPATASRSGFTSIYQARCTLGLSDALRLTTHVGGQITGTPDLRPGSRPRRSPAPSRRRPRAARSTV